MKTSFGGRKPYYTDFEMAEDISPDPSSEEIFAKSLKYPVRSAGGKPKFKTVPPKTEENSSNPT